MEKLIVTVAPSSNFHGKDANPALPYSPQEVADSVYECWNEGSSIVHIHGRDERGLPTNDPAFFQEADRLIRKKNCDIIIQHSMAPANPVLLGLETVDINDGLRTSKTNPPPEMVSLEVAPANIMHEGKVYDTPWNRLWGERVAKDLLERGIKPEIELGNNANVEDLKYLIERGVLKKPYYVNIVQGMHKAVSNVCPYSPKHMMHLVELLPSDTIFCALGIGPAQFEATTLSILLGGNVRVGFEDNIHIERGKLAKSNAELVAKVVRIAKELGRKIASPNETREMLGIPKLDL